MGVYALDSSALVSVRSTEKLTEASVPLVRDSKKQYGGTALSAAAVGTVPSRAIRAVARLNGVDHFRLAEVAAFFPRCSGTLASSPVLGIPDPALLPHASE